MISLPPFFSHFDARRKYVQASVEYNSTGQKLDIWMPDNAYNAPVLMWVPGGAWAIGDRRFQGYQLMSSLCDQGWICVSVGYRTAPKNRWPAPYEDVQAAWEWVRTNIHDFGASDDFMAVAGASAGGHMASLLGLTDTSYSRPDAVISLYGVYSWVEHGYDSWLVNRWTETVVAGSRQRGTLWNASPMSHVHPDAPPFLIIHGDRDLIAPVSVARKFYDRLDEATANESAWYHEIPGGAHAFDLINADQAAAAVDSIDLFLREAQKNLARAS